MAVIETWFEQDLQKAVQVQHLDGSLFSNNANGNRIGVVVYNNGVAASLSGTVSGYAVLPDGTTVPCTGSLSGNRASVLIPAAAYQPGIIFVSVFLTSGSTVTTLAAVAANVQQARTDSQVSPGSAVTDWTQTINAAMQSVVTANAANMAVEYGSLTYPVPVGKYTIYNDLLYRCTTPIATAESWTASHWTRVRIADEVSDLKSAFDDLNINHYVHEPIDFDWNYGYINYSGQIVTDGETYSYTRLISKDEFYSMKITTIGALEVWAYNADGTYFGKRSDIPANSTDFTPTSSWLSTATQCRMVVVTSKKANVSAYIPVELATKKQLTEVADDVGDLETEIDGVSDRVTGIESTVEDLQDDLIVHHTIDFDWNYGYIDYSGNINTDSETYSYSRLISSTQFYAMKISTQASIEVWAYNADGTYFGKRSNIPANSEDFTPTSGWLSTATQCRLVVVTAKRSLIIASTATIMASKEYVDNSLADYYNGEVSVSFLIDNPMYCKRYTGNRLTETEDGVLEGAWIKFDKITIQGLLGTKSKTWNEFKNDIANDHYYDFRTADNFTQDALRIPPEACVLYNYKTNEFHYFTKYYFSLHTFTRDETILFTCDASSNPSGMLYLYSLGIEKGIGRYIRTISKDEVKLLGYSDKFVFAFSTDCHFYWDNNGYKNYNNDMIRELKTAIGFDCYINGGDSVYNGTHYKSNGVHSLTRVFDVPIDNFVYCIGNHDYNNTALQETQNESFMFGSDAIESLIYRKLQNIERPNGVRYYYRDFADKKTRVISLDTMDVPIAFDDNGDLTTPNPGITYVIRQDQIDWLCNVLDCPSNDWAVIIVMHVGLYSENEGFSLNSPLTNRTSVKAVLSAYVNKTTYNYLETSTYPVSGSGTFANAKGHLVGVWSGHAHVDDYVNTDGFNAIQTQSGYPDTNERIVGTIDEICVDCCCIDMANKKVKLTRFGPGADREYSFE